ncbi:MAG TPA: energy transducer TonB [Polyangiaceae bacterium]
MRRLTLVGQLQPLLSGQEHMKPELRRTGGKKVTVGTSHCHMKVTWPRQLGFTMKRPVSTDELPLSDLIRFAAENRLTAALELRSRLVAGRISIRDGEVIDAVFGGLEGEAAIHAAMASRSLSVFRGRPPSRSAARRVFAPLQELVGSVIPRKSSPRASLGKLNFDGTRPTTSTLHAAKSEPTQRIEPSRPSQLQGLGAMLLVGVAAVVGIASWLQGSKVRERPQPEFAGNREQPGVRIPAKWIASRLPSCPVSDCDIGALPVQVLVDALGTAQGAKVENTRPELQALEDAAIRYALSARYQPATLGGHRVTSWLELPVRFTPNISSKTADNRPSADAEQRSKYLTVSSLEGSRAQ